MMNYKHPLSDSLINTVKSFKEFANGAAQATVILDDGRVFKKALISNSKAIIALRGYTDLPFTIGEIQEIYQTEEDLNPKDISNWQFWDEWK